jgi:hypothetical protein
LIASLFLAIIAANNFLNMKYGRLAVLTAVLFTAQSAVAQVNVRLLAGAVPPNKLPGSVMVSPTA